MNRSLRRIIESHAKDVRAWALGRLRSPKDNLCGWCGRNAVELWLRLKAVGIESAIHVYIGRSYAHAYLVIDDHVVDTTATQFMEFGHVPIVIMHSKEAEVYSFYNSGEIFATAKEFRAWQMKEGWPRSQQAFAKMQTKPKQLLTA